ncbi:Ca2+-binding protein [Commensalibacter communis]|uniref:RTX toxin-related n=1 Tax=Commensalibacter communis TaxID=2972786 RepID=A0A9W4TNX7_9PROT|nr:calcium-binding protein [Commensalibacter communis]CAI3947312.1 Ca2+-binding protein [Commensalibacter communis]CAI3947768.1 Ca2+-binding protein [Commensalibacter communis]CAI3951083.1 Ca2+-binding protein [Commensalibacter communis]CAI3957447.1 Ca2+-binding protein [Commensalibacter communis]
MSENTTDQTDVILEDALQNDPITIDDSAYTPITGSKKPIQLDDKNYLLKLGNKSDITGGNGNNTITQHGSYAKVTLGDGDNNLSENYGGYNTYIFGNGNNTITSGNPTNNIYILGDGNNHIEARGGNTTIGDGNNDVDVRSGNVTIGGGDNTIRTWQGGNAIVGNGNNTITIGSDNMVIGNGNNTITYGSGNTTIGGGNNIINYGLGNLHVGDGDNSFNIRGTNVTVGGGNNQFVTGNGSDNIHIGSGNATITATMGMHTITGGSANSYIAATINGGSNAVDLTGNVNLVYGRGNDNSPLNVNGNATISGLQTDQTVSINGKSIFNNVLIKNLDLNGNTTITGGVDTNISLLRGNYDSKSLLTNSINTTVNALYGNIDVDGGHSNQFNYINGNINLSSASATVNYFTGGTANIKGSGYSNTTFKTFSKEDSIFTAGDGNETLNGSGSSGAFAVYANVDQKTSEERTALTAIGGSGDDTLTAGSGDSVFTGGTGSNLFAFTKENVAGGTTVITDFSASRDNQIALFDYGLNRNSLSKLLKSSQNNAHGDAVLNLENHSVTLQGVSVSDLNTNQFFIYNNK